MTTKGDEEGPGPEPGDEHVETALTHVADVVGDLVSGASIPAPLRKNAFRAFNQLCTAVIDIPVSYLEGIAAERRAETQARIKIISTGADQIAKQMNVDPEYARTAVRKFGQRIVREQVNLDQITEAAARQLNPSTSHEVVPDAEPAPMDDDWINTFEKEASEKSSVEMQALFARILAGEIRRPSTFSIKTVKLLGQLDVRVAALFQRLCSLSVSMRLPGRVLDARVVSLRGSAASNSLLQYGLGFDNLNLLHEHGLIIPDYNSYMMYSPAIVVGNSVGIGITYKNELWALKPIADGADKEAKLHGVALSRSGAELLTVVDIKPDEQYSAALMEYFATYKYEMVRVLSGGGA
jgi:hypothetical protein